MRVNLSRRWPLWAQLTAGLFAAIVLLRIISFLLISEFIEKAIIDVFEMEQQYVLPNINSHVALDSNGAPMLDSGFVDPRFETPRSGFYWTIRLPNGNVVSSKSLEGRALPLLPASKDGVSVELDTPLGPVFQTQKSFPARNGLSGQRIAFAISADQVDRKTHEINKKRGVINTIFVFVLVVLTGAILWKTSAPIRRASREIDEVSEGTRKILSDDYPSDVQRLADKFNEILQNHRNAFDQSSLVLASFNHNIRSGLAKVLYQVDGLRQDPHAVEPGDIVSQIESLQRHLVLYTNSFRSPELQYLMLKPPLMNVETELEDVLASNQRVHNDRQLDWYLGVGPAVNMPCDARSFRNILFNLLDNAGQWARHRVACTWDVNDGQLSVLVEDDGPGLDGSADKESNQGMGVGLQIAHELAAMLGGTIESGKSRLGGARFCLTIPVVPQR